MQLIVAVEDESRRPEALLSDVAQEVSDLVPNAKVEIDRKSSALVVTCPSMTKSAVAEMRRQLKRCKHVLDVEEELPLEGPDLHFEKR
jgi:hypothetical protein